ncbi:GntR family transcriptional regulator [Pseudonocardia kunmingensis]|uniref:GntR family transcriptional regulator n=1 Tax=Pseudonocardia kunmingensis TaxID=630975 RepID=UPI001B85F5C1|nr:GntR family transcriptional regulator [Pseudonocardia kunmingensis]
MATPSSKLYRNQKPLRDIVGDQIRSHIFSGAFPPGSRLVERELAERFDVSRLPVREALRVLQNEGLVENLSSRGIVVKTLTERDVIELFDIREALEVLAVRLAAARVADNAPHKLRHYVNEAQQAIARGAPDAAHAANSQFHDEIIALSGNELLQSMLEPLLGRLHWLFRQIPDFERLSAEHDELCSAIEAAEPERAAEVARAHVLSYRRLTLAHLFG